MTATHNPQTAAHQARTAYRNMTDQLGHLGLDTTVPEGVRAIAEKTVAQTREAYDRSLDAFDVSLTTFERSFEAAGQGMRQPQSRELLQNILFLFKACTPLKVPTMHEMIGVAHPRCVLRNV
jgi:hypothetical protein